MRKKSSFAYHILIRKVFGDIIEFFSEDDAMEIIFGVFCHVQKVALPLTHDLQFLRTKQ